MGKNDCFQVVYTQGVTETVRILLDTQTGALYLQTISGYAGGLTPLLDGAGKPMRWGTEADACI